MNQLQIPTADAPAYAPGRVVLADFDTTDWDGTDDAAWSGDAFAELFGDVDRYAHAHAARALFAAR